MHVRTKFSRNDWIDAPGGLGQVHEVNSVYCEENDYRVASGEKKVGELDKVVVIYKLLCDLEYMFVSRDRWRYATITSCHKIRKKDRSSVEALLKHSHTEFCRYAEDVNNDWIGQTWLFDGLVMTKFKDTYLRKCDIIAGELGDEFNLVQFQQCLYKYSMPIPIVPDPAIDFDSKGNLRLMIFNGLFRSRGKRSIYTNFSYEFVDNFEVIRK